MSSVVGWRSGWMGECVGESPPLRVIFVCDPTIPRAIAWCANSVGKLRIRMESERCRATLKLGVVRRHPGCIRSARKRSVLCVGDADVHLFCWYRLLYCFQFAQDFITPQPTFPMFLSPSELSSISTSEKNIDLILLRLRYHSRFQTSVVHLHFFFLPGWVSSRSTPLMIPASVGSSCPRYFLCAVYA